MNLPGDLFTAVVNMSITASCVAVGVILVRLLLKKAPKIFSYILWAPVLFRLVCPFSFGSAFSIFNLVSLDAKQGSGAYEFVPRNTGMIQAPASQSANNVFDSAANVLLPAADPTASADPVQIWLAVLSLVWILGVITLLTYSIVSYVKTKGKLQTATRVDGNVFETDAVETAVVCGFIRPKIYVPLNIRDTDLSYILEHERTHIRRKDHLVKPLAYLALILHWFNPLMWLCFSLMSRDMEMSCDESVLRKLGDGAKGGYSGSLLSLAVKRKGLLAANPLAFGENYVKTRIKNILDFRKPAFWVTVVAVIAVCAAVIAFTTDKKDDNYMDPYLGYSIKALMNNKTPYVGNNSKVVGLIDAMPLPRGITRDTVELQTAEMPYGITINYIMTDPAGINSNGDISGDAFQRNAIVLFSLVDNVDVINCRITDKTEGKHDGTTYTFTCTREAAEELLGRDLRSFAENAGAIRSLIGMINDISFEGNHSSATSVSEIGDTLNGSEQTAAAPSDPTPPEHDPSFYTPSVNEGQYELLVEVRPNVIPMHKIQLSRLDISITNISEEEYRGRFVAGIEQFDGNGWVDISGAGSSLYPLTSLKKGETYELEKRFSVKFTPGRYRLKIDEWYGEFEVVPSNPDMISVEFDPNPITFDDFISSGIVVSIRNMSDEIYEGGLGVDRLECFDGSEWVKAPWVEGANVVDQVRLRIGPGEARSVARLKADMFDYDYSPGKYRVRYDQWYGEFEII